MQSFHHIFIKLLSTDSFFLLTFQNPPYVKHDISAGLKKPDCYRSLNTPLFVGFSSPFEKEQMNNGQPFAIVSLFKFAQ